MVVDMTTRGHGTFKRDKEGLEKKLNYLREWFFIP